jgi:hypothetical protein
MMKASDMSLQEKILYHRFIKRYMTPVWQGVRLSGQLIIWIGAWRYNRRWIGLGLLMIILGWANGLLRPPKASDG